MGEDVLLDEQIHEVSSGEVLHDEVEVVGVLEGALESHHPGVVFGVGQNIPLFPGLHDFVLEDHFAFFEFLDCHWLYGLVPAAQPHLPEGSLPDDPHRLEVEDGYLLAVLPQLGCFFVGDVFFELLLLEGGHSQGRHLGIELFPVLAFLLFELYHLGVALLDEILGRLHFLFGGLGYHDIFRFL